MRYIFFVLSILALAWPVAPAAAANKWIASNGTGNTCSRAAPCPGPFEGFGAAAAGDTIRCVDTGEYSNLISSKSVSIDCTNMNAVMQALSYNNLPAGALVSVEGLSFDCASNIFYNSAGLSFVGSGTFVIRNVTVRNCPNGIVFKPTGRSKLVIMDTKVFNNAGAGVIIQPSGAGSVQVEISGLEATGNQGGVYSQGSAGSITDLQIRNSVISQNSNYGVVSVGAGGPSVAFVDNSSVSENANIGLYSTGASAFLFVNGSTLERNNIGWSFAGGGALVSFGNNVVNSGSGVGGPSAIFSLE